MRVERELARLVHPRECAGKVAEEPDVSRIISHRHVLFGYAPVNVIAQVGKDFVENSGAGLGLRLGYNERRVDPDARKVAHQKESALERLPEDDFSDFAAHQRFRLQVADEIDPDEQALAADVADEFVFFLKCVETGEQYRADLARILDQVLVANRLDRLGNGDCRKRIADVTRRRRAGLRERLCASEFVAHQHARNREARAHPLADGHDVGRDAAVLDAPHLPGTPEAGDHFVGDEQRALVLGDGLDRGHPVVGRDNVAGRTLDWLDDYRGDIAGGRIFDLLAREIDAGKPARGVLELERASIAVGVGHLIAAARQRAVALLRLVADKTDYAAGLAVKATPKAHDLVLLRRGARQTQRGLDRLGAATIKMRALEIPRRRSRKQFERLGTFTRRKSSHDKTRGLTRERPAQRGMAVAKAGDRYAGIKIEVNVVVGVGQGRAFAMIEGDTGKERNTLAARRDVALFVRKNFARLRARYRRRDTRQLAIHAHAAIPVRVANRRGLHLIRLWVAVGCEIIEPVPVRCASPAGSSQAAGGMGSGSV